MITKPGGSARLLTEIKTEPRTAQERGSTQINILKNTPLITPSADQQKFRQAATPRGQGRSKKQKHPAEVMGEPEGLLKPDLHAPARSQRRLAEALA